MSRERYRTMVLFVALLTLAIVGSVAHAHEGFDCDADCQAVSAAGKRHTNAMGGPDKGEVCFHLLMKNRETAVAMTVKYPDGRPNFRWTYPTGSAAHSAGKPKRGLPERLPLFCIPAKMLEGAVAARICTDTHGEGGSTTLTEEHIHYLLQVRQVPESEPACLLGIEECRKGDSNRE